MLKAKRLTTDSSAGTKTHRHPFWKTASVPQVSEAETIKNKATSSSSKPPARPQPQPQLSQSQPVTQSTSASNTTYSRQNPASSSFHVVRANPTHNQQQQATTTSTPVVAAAAATSAPASSRVQAPIPVPSHHQQQAAFANKNINNKPSSSNPPIPKPGSSAVHRVSVQSLNSVNTASTSRSSFEHISAENLEHSWGSGATTFSTAPSSTFPQKSTDSLVRIPAAATTTTSELRDQTSAASRRFPLVESDSQRTKPVEPSSKTHGDTQGEQASNALPLPNSEYESPARVRSLRRSKPNINLSSTSVRDATSTTGRQSPAPGPSSIAPTSSAVAAAATAEPQEHHHHQRSKSDMLSITEFAYVRPNRMEEHVRGGSGDHGRATLLARVMATSSTKHTQSPSTASARTMPATTTQPRVSSHSQQANPNMTKLKQTSIPRISTSGIATASPMIEQTRQFDSLQSPLKASADHSLSAWTSVKSPTMTSSSYTNPVAAAYSTLTSASVMSPNLSSVTSPRTLVSGSHHHSDVAAITPAQQHYSLSSSASSVASSSAVSSSTITTRTPYVEADYDSPSSTATPGSPASNTVRALFSSFTSRSHRNSTPHPPIRGSSLSNPPITAQEVDSPRMQQLQQQQQHILSPPPLPPQSTRPDAPQQSFTALHHAQIQAQQEQLFHQQLFNTISSPRHGTPDLRTSLHSSRPSVDSRRELGGLRSPSPNSILRSYGLANGANNAVQSPSVNAQKQLTGTPLFHSPRTLMSDAEVTTVTHVSITRSTVVMPADQAVAYGHSIERRNSSSSSRNSPVVSTNSRGNNGNGSQPQFANSIPSQTPQSPLSQSQPVQGGFFGIFRPKSPRHPFPRAESPAPAAPLPVPSKTPPPRTATASPSGRRFAFSLPINLRHKPKKSISGASVEARVGTPGGDGPMSSQGSLLLPTASSSRGAPEVHFSEIPAGHGDGQTENNGRRVAAASSVMGRRDAAMETDTEFEDGGEDDDYQPIEMKMREVQQWSQTIEANWATSGKRRSRPGVSFDVPASESERDDTGMTAVSVAPGGGRMLRYARAHARQHQQFSQQFSDNESLAVY